MLGCNSTLKTLFCFSLSLSPFLSLSHSVCLSFSFPLYWHRAPFFAFISYKFKSKAYSSILHNIVYKHTQYRIIVITLIYSLHALHTHILIQFIHQVHTVFAFFIRKYNRPIDNHIQINLHKLTIDQKMRKKIVKLFCNMFICWLYCHYIVKMSTPSHFSNLCSVPQFSTCMYIGTCECVRAFQFGCLGYIFVWVWVSLCQCSYMYACKFQNTKRLRELYRPVQIMFESVCQMVE